MNYAKLVRSVPDDWLRIALLGKMIAVFGLGAVFSRQLISAGFGPFGLGYMLIAIAVVVLVSTLNTNFLSWKRNKKVSVWHYYGVYTGLSLLVLFFGMQSPHVPYKEGVVVIGLVMMLPAYYYMLKNG